MTTLKANAVQPQKLPQELPSKPVILLAVSSLVVAIIIYLGKFALDGSSTQETWGQFGDFVGGLVNPLIGLCTIWLLVGSLKQSHITLLQAHADLETTRQILDETQKTQKATEESLKQQVEIADQTRDISNALRIREMLKNDLIKMGGTQVRAVSKAEGQLFELNQILDLEMQRLRNKYQTKREPID